MDEEKEYISKDELGNILVAKNKVIQLAQAATKANDEVKIADLEYRVVVQHVFIQHNLTVDDKIDDATGEITRLEDSEEGIEDTKDDTTVEVVSNES